MKPVGLDYHYIPYGVQHLITHLNGLNGSVQQTCEGTSQGLTLCSTRSIRRPFCRGGGKEGAYGVLPIRPTFLVSTDW